MGVHPTGGVSSVANQSLLRGNKLMTDFAQEARSVVPETRLGEQGEPIHDERCRECHTSLGAGYLCDECDTVEIEE